MYLAGKAARKKPSPLGLGRRWGCPCLEHKVNTRADLLWSGGLTRNERKTRKSLRPESGSTWQSYVGVGERWGKSESVRQRLNLGE